MIADDLATLRNALGIYNKAGEVRSALDGVEAEIARLESQAATATREANRRQVSINLAEQRAEAAEAEVASWKSTAHNCGARVRELEAEAARLRDGLRVFVEGYDFHAADYLADDSDARVFTARTVESLIEDQRKARALLAEDGAAEPARLDGPR